jgi:hypothetical protein
MPSADEVKRLYVKTRQVKERNKKLKNEQDDIINLLKNDNKREQTKIGFGESHNSPKNNNKHSTGKEYKTNNIRDNSINLNEKQTQIAVNIQKLIDIKL